MFQAVDSRQSLLLHSGLTEASEMFLKAASHYNGPFWGLHLHGSVLQHQQSLKRVNLKAIANFIIAK